MSERRNKQKQDYNKKAYVSYLYRVRADSVLADRLGAFATEGDTSVNFLITKALCEYMGLQLPCKHCFTYKRDRIFPPKFP